MRIKKHLKIGVKSAFFGCFLFFIGILGSLFTPYLNNQTVYAEPQQEEVVLDEETNTENENNSNENSSESGATGENIASLTSLTSDECQDSLGSLGWLVCPTTGKIAEATDWLYEKIEDILVINPISMEDGTPIYEIWKYCRGLTNIVFIIFLLVVIYSQITGVGINNYGIKKILPKLIITVILVNMSFLICSAVVDVSNVVGNSLRGLFGAIAETAVIPTSGGEEAVVEDFSVETKLAYADMYRALAGGSALLVGGGMIAFEAGAIWMLIPVVFGAFVAVVSGLITIALRQAVVTLLIMISPLAMVAYILPNTETWFKKWKELLTKMLVFYPMFSLLFGASNLAGFAIIASAKDGFGIILGTAVQIFPLFFSWSLMKMSGTFLGTINAKLRELASGPLAANRAWAESHRQLTKQKFLASSRAVTPSQKLMQFLSDRKVAREAELSEKTEEVKNRGLAYHASSHYRKDGSPSRKGESAYRTQSKIMNYQEVIARDKNTFEKGLGYLATNSIQKARLEKLDIDNVTASDRLKAEIARGELIEYENAIGFHQRMEGAINAHMDLENGFKEEVGEDGKIIRKPRSDYKFHYDVANLEKTEEMARYNAMRQIMEGKEADVQYIAGTAAQSYDTQKKIIDTKMGKYFEYTPPTKDVEYRLQELTKSENALASIDSIISGLRVLNQRGDTDLLKEQLDNVLSHGLQLGTHASQALASFLMFEVKDSDPFLRRFGKYINLETARAYNANDRKVMEVTYDEYIKGYHDGEPDTGKYPDGRMYAKKGMKTLTEGTSLDNIERTALSNLDDSIKQAYGFDKKHPEKEWDIDGYLRKREEIQTSFEPAFLSSSLKWLSGSEQINSGVKFWTGYELKQKKENGKVVVDKDGNPEYILNPVWEDKDNGFGERKGDVETYYRRKTKDYIKDQTVGQILGMRTDYRDPIMEHFAKMYLEDDSEEETSEQRQTDYKRAVAEIQTRYGDRDINEAKRLREKDLRALKVDMASKQIRKTLGETGKLEQIYRTRRSGAANNAKDWWRDWIGLGDEVAINSYLEKIDKARRKKYKESTAKSSPDGTSGVSRGGFDEGDRAFFTSQIRTIYDSWRGFDEDKFYEESVDWVKKNLDGVGDVILKKYAEYYEANPYADDHDLMEYLQDLLRDPDNY